MDQELQQTAAPAAPAKPAAPAATETPIQPGSASSATDPVIPLDKFKTMRADGTVDIAASVRKTNESYTHLVKRLGSGDVPPETETGYKLDYSSFPPGVKMNPDDEKSLLKSLHASGMTNKQVQTVISKYGEVFKKGLEIQTKQEASRVTATLNDVATELENTWGAENEKNVATARRVFNAVADEQDKADVAKIGKDAKVTYRTLMKVLAKIGAEEASRLNDVEKDLKTTWGEAFTQNQEAAIRGFNAVADEQDKADSSKIGKDAKATYKILMKVLAKIGAGMKEDGSVIHNGFDAKPLEQLRTSEAYLKEDHPDHKATVAKVTALYQQKYNK